jgi:3-oxoadipate enol-lactonase
MPKAAINGVNINYQLDGTERAPVLMFSNSLGSNLTMWDRHIPAFEKDYRILRYDSRGHGQSDAPVGDTASRCGPRTRSP